MKNNRFYSLFLTVHLFISAAILLFNTVTAHAALGETAAPGGAVAVDTASTTTAPASATAPTLPTTPPSLTPDILACHKAIADREKEFKPLYEKVMALKDDKRDDKKDDKNAAKIAGIKKELTKLRDEVKFERMKDNPPATLIDCNRMLSDLHAAIRFANDKLKL